MSSPHSDAPLDPGEICHRIMDNACEAAFQMRGGVMEWISPRAVDVVGWRPADIVGGSVRDLCHPDDREAWAAMRERAQRGGAASRPIRVKHRNGKYVLVDARLGHGGGRASDRLVVGSFRAVGPGADGAVDGTDIAYRLMAELAHDVVAIVDRAGVVLQVSRSVTSWLGWLPEEMVGTFLPALVHPDDRPRMTAYRDAVQADTQTGSVEQRVHTRGGRWKWVSATGVMVPNRNGDHVVAVSWRDIDDLVRARDVAERETERLRAVLDSSLDPRVMLTAVRDDAGSITDFRIDDANARACDALGLSRDRLIGARLLDTFPGVRDGGLLNGYIEAVEYGTPFELDDVLYSSETLGVTRRYDIRAHAAGDALMFTWRDVTERSTAADEATQAAMHFRAVSEHAGDAVLRVENGRITWMACSGHWTLPIARGDEMTPALTHLLHPDDQRQAGHMEIMLASGLPFTAIWRVIDAEGAEHPVALRAEAIGASVDARTDVVLTLADLGQRQPGRHVDADAARLMEWYRQDATGE